MKQLIIDGHNTIHRIPFLKRQLDMDHESARQSLISLVQNWKLKENYSGKITIVFDGQDGYLQQNMNAGTIRVVYSGSEERLTTAFFLLSEIAEKNLF